MAASETRIAEQEALIAGLQAQLTELQNRPAPEPQVVEKVVEKIVEVEKPVEVIKEVVVEKPVVVAAPVAEPEPETETEVEEAEQEAEPVVEPAITEEEEETAEQESETESAEVSEQATETTEVTENTETTEVTEQPEAPIQEEPASPKAALYGKAVDDIRLAISLGDRFLYQRELFSQNAEKMQRTLDELNRLGSFDEAMDYINSHFQWDTESKTYQQFLVTLHRRFG